MPRTRRRAGGAPRSPGSIRACVPASADRSSGKAVRSACSSTTRGKRSGWVNSTENSPFGRCSGSPAPSPGTCRGPAGCGRTCWPAWNCSPTPPTRARSCVGRVETAPRSRRTAAPASMPASASTCRSEPASSPACSTYVGRLRLRAVRRRASPAGGRRRPVLTNPREGISEPNTPRVADRKQEWRLPGFRLGKTRRDR